MHPEKSTKAKSTYTVQVTNLDTRDVTRCGHQHKTWDAADNCRDKLTGAKLSNSMPPEKLKERMLWRPSPMRRVEIVEAVR